MLTLFQPATGQVRVQPVDQATNAVLHPWLKGELIQILADLPEQSAEQAPDWGRSWSDWGLGDEAAVYGWPSIRLIMVWDNLTGHRTPDMVDWCHEQGIALLYTPLGGSWLNMAESIQRILVRRALAGQHPESADEIKEWLAATARGWNADPTPFTWRGKRWERRQRARDRHALGASRAFTRRPVRRRWQSDDRTKTIHRAT
jgi:hypothetical protein